MRVTNERAKDHIIACDLLLERGYAPSVIDKIVKDYAADLLEARERIKEMREDLLKISQYPIAFVCEEARFIAREAWKKSMEVTE